MSNPPILDDYTADQIAALQAAVVERVPTLPEGWRDGGLQRTARCAMTQLSDAGLEFVAMTTYYDQYVPVVGISVRQRPADHPCIPDHLRVELTDTERATVQLLIHQFGIGNPLAHHHGAAQHAVQENGLGLDWWKDFTHVVAGRVQLYSDLRRDVAAAPAGLDHLPESFALGLAASALDLAGLALDSEHNWDALARAGVSCSAFGVGIVATDLSAFSLLGLIGLAGIVSAYQECSQSLGPAADELARVLELESRARQAAETIGSKAEATHYGRPSENAIQLFQRHSLRDSWTHTPGLHANQHSVNHENGGSGTGSFIQHGNTRMYNYSGDVCGSDGHFETCPPDDPVQSWVQDGTTTGNTLP